MCTNVKNVDGAVTPYIAPFGYCSRGSYNRRQRRLYSSGSSIWRDAPVIALLKNEELYLKCLLLFYRILLSICKNNVKQNLFFIHELVNNLLYKNDLSS